MKKYIFLALSCLMILVLCGSSAAAEMPDNNYVNLDVSNDNGARIDEHSDDTYTFFNGAGTGGTNSLKINNDTGSTAAEVINTSAQSGTFYMVTTGGQGRVDEGILMLAVNGTIPDNFAVHITASGYTWNAASGFIPTQGDLTYNAAALDETFYKSDFLYDSQIWRPYYQANYPIYEKQDMTNTGNTFHVMLIDLYSGLLLGANYNSLIDNGAIKIQYSFQNLPAASLASFNAYGFSTTPETGQTLGSVQWTNRVNTATQTQTGVSGYNVVNPDLLVSDLEVPSTADVGQDYTVTATVLNNGISDAGEFLVYLWESGTRVGAQTVSGLGAKQSINVEFTWTPKTAGTRALQARVDPTNTMVESNENNNKSPLETVTVTETRPDITITNFEVPENAETGTPYTITLDITNNGATDITNDFLVYLWESGTRVGIQTVNGLNSGQTKIVTFTWTPQTTGDRTLQARTDPTNTVTESNENNNKSPLETIQVT